MTNDPGASTDDLYDRRPPVAFTVEVAIAGLIVFAVAITIGLVTNATGGSIAEWLAAVATVAAFIAALYAGWFAHRALLVEQRRDRHRDRLERSAEALHVAVWGAGYLTALHSVGDSGEVVGPTLPDLLVATAQNAGHLPVHDLWIQVYLPSDDAASSWDLVADVPHGILLAGGTVEIEVLPTRSAGGASDLRFPDPSSPMFLRLCKEFEARGTPPSRDFVHRLGCSFRDNNYVEWVRLPDVGVREMPRPRVPD